MVSGGSVALVQTCSETSAAEDVLANEICEALKGGFRAVGENQGDRESKGLSEESGQLGEPSMSYIPDSAIWYIAEIVEEISVESDPRNVIHRNMVLIHDNSAEEAYSKALEHGKHAETSYQNPEGKRFCIRFRGLRDLMVVHDDLEHGAE